MPILPQLVFDASFVGTFAALYFLTSYIGELLRSYGYDVSDIILIGLEKKDFGGNPLPKMWSAADVVNIVKADKSVQAAVVAGVVTIVFLLSKVLKSSRCFLWDEKLGHVANARTAEKKPVLDPQQWKEFPLVEKFAISPNTAL